MTSSCCSDVATPCVIEKLPPGWTTARVRFLRHDGRESSHIEIIDLKTNKRYLHEPLCVTACKCFMLALAIPVYTAIYMAWNTIRIPTTAAASLVRGVKGAFRAETGREAGKQIGKALCKSGSAVRAGVWTVVQTPFYALQMFFGALVGIANPLAGRKILEAESRLHAPLTIRDDLQYAGSHGEEIGEFRAAWESLFDMDYPRTTFLAFCMQPRGTTTDAHIIAVDPLLPSERDSSRDA